MILHSALDSGKRGGYIMEENREKLIREQYGPIYGLAYGIVRNQDDAAEITQETFLRYLNQGYTNIGYLYRIASNLSADCLKERKRFSVRPNDEIYELLESGVLAPTEALDAYYRELVRDAVLTLPEKYRVVVTLRYYSLLSVKAIAEVLGTTTGTVKTRLYRGRKRLATLLSKSAVGSYLLFA